MTLWGEGKGKGKRGSGGGPGSHNANANTAQQGTVLLLHPHNNNITELANGRAPFASFRPLVREIAALGSAAAAACVPSCGAEEWRGLVLSLGQLSVVFVSPYSSLVAAALSASNAPVAAMTSRGDAENVSWMVSDECTWVPEELRSGVVIFFSSRLVEILVVTGEFDVTWRPAICGLLLIEFWGWWVSGVLVTRW